MLPNDDLRHAHDRLSQQTPDKQARILLVHMPFGSIKWPALGISLLKAAIVQKGIACDIRYLNLPFAARIGVPLYKWLSITSPAVSLFGERLFAHDLFRDRGGRDPDRFEDVEALNRDLERPPDLAQSLRHIRDGVGAYLDDCMSSVPWARYDIVGFTSTFQQNIPSLALARRIKETWPDKVIVFGGANCEAEMGLELHRQFPFVDFVCRGESDVLFPNLVASLVTGGAPPEWPGLVARRNGQSIPFGNGASAVTDMDSLPYPDFDDYFDQLGRSSLNITSQVELLFETGRGCWYGAKQHCTFCGLNGATMAFRSKSPGRVVEELLHLTGRYGVKRAMAVDNILDMRYLRDVIPELIARQAGLSIFYEVKANLRKDQLRLLKQAGVATLQPGIESLSTSILKLMRKGCTAIQNVQLLKWANEVGTELSWGIIRGFPGEEPEEYARMAEMIPSLIHLQPPYGIFGLRLDRFSPQFNDARAFGITNIRPGMGYRRAYALPESSLEQLAYHFDYDHVDGRDPDSYSASLRAEVRYWQGHYSPGGLTMLSDAETLTISDRRPGATKARIVLDGAERAAYEYCDEAHRFEAVHHHVHERGYPVGESALRGLLDQWVANRLMLHDGGWFLSLAVRADDWWQVGSDSDQIREALTGALVELVAARRAPVSDSPAHPDQ